MDTFTLILGNFLFLSALGNIYLVFRLRRQKTKPQYSLEARDLLRDLMSGPAILKVERIDPGSVFQHSPRTL